MQACGPFSLDPVFVFENRADVVRSDYIAGKIGVIRPRYTRGNLVVAYRYFNRLPFAPAEQKAVLGFWGENAEDNSASDDDLIKRWVELRKKIVGDEPSPQIQVNKKADSYSYFRSCTTNALEIAAKTLETRIAEHGANDSAVADWMRAQETVFANCGGGKNIPAEAAANAPVWLKKDRAYQQAAAEFYIGNFAEARRRFEGIAADETSVWHELSDYLVARTLIRQANFGTDQALRKNSLETAEARLEKIYRGQSKHRLNALAMLMPNCDQTNSFSIWQSL